MPASLTSWRSIINGSHMDFLQKVHAWAHEAITDLWLGAWFGLTPEQGGWGDPQAGSPRGTMAAALWEIRVFLEGREFAGEGAFAAVGRVAVDGAVFDRAIEFGTEFAGLRGRGGFVLGGESGSGFARKGFEGAEGAAVARGPDFRLTGAFGGGFDVGHRYWFVALVPGGRIELPTKGL